MGNALASCFVEIKDKEQPQTICLSDKGQNAPCLKGRTDTTLAPCLRSRTKRRTALLLLVGGGIWPGNGIQRDKNGNVQSQIDMPNLDWLALLHVCMSFT